MTNLHNTLAECEAPFLAADQIIDSLYSWEAFRNMRIERAHLLMQRILPFIEDPSRPGRLLEIGVGKGDLGAHICSYGCEYTGIDLKDQRIEYPGKEPFPFALANGAKLPFRNNSFDTALLSFVLHHIPEDLISDVIGEALRVSSRNLVILEDYIGDGPDSRTLLRGYTVTVDSLLNCGVPGGNFGNQKPISRWLQIIDEAGGEVKNLERFSSRALGFIPVRHMLLNIQRRPSRF